MKKLRKSRGMTQRELGEYLNLSDRVIGYYEADRHFPDGDVLVKIADLFNVSVDFLLGRTNNPNILVIKDDNFEFGIDKERLKEAEKLKEIQKLLEEAMKKLNEK